MKKLLTTALLGLTLALGTLPLRADKTISENDRQRAQRTQVTEIMKTDEGCQMMCDEMMKSPKSKKMMMETMMKDPEAKKMMMDNHGNAKP